MDVAYKNRADLRRAYQSAFADWAKEVRSLQASMGDAPVTSDGWERVRRCSKRAEHEYRKSRDLLFQSMVR